jgi:hypothetical protein
MWLRRHVTMQCDCARFVRSVFEHPVVMSGRKQFPLLFEMANIRINSSPTMGSFGRKSC